MGVLERSVSIVLRRSFGDGGRRELLPGCAFGGAQFVDEAVYVLLANALAGGFGAAIGVDVVPPRAAFVVAESLANEFAHSATLPLGDGLGTLQHVRGKGYGEGSGIAHGDIV